MSTQMKKVSKLIIAKNKILLTPNISPIVDLDIAFPLETYGTIMNFIKDNTGELNFITRDKIYLLSHAYPLFYDKENKRFEIYFLKDNGLINIHDTTTKELKSYHSIYNLYLGGEFDTN